MLRLILLRHAKSSWAEPDRPDFDRPLIPRGRRAASQIGGYLAAKRLQPDLILCSSARRTRETLAALLPFLRGDVAIRLTTELYDTTTAAYHKAIVRWGGDATTVLVIGHNPTMEEFAAEILSPPKSDDFTLHFPTAAFALVEFDISDWKKLKSGSGRLAAFVEPRSLSVSGAEADPDDTVER